jgi:hypothetical protein
VQSTSIPSRPRVPAPPGGVPLEPRSAPCLRDTASVVGLDGLVDTDPTWRSRLRRDAAPAPELRDTTVVRDVVGTAFDRRCLPTPTGPHTSILGPRSYARRLREQLPDLLLARVDAASLDDLERRLGTSMRPPAAHRAANHLRYLANQWRSATGRPQLPKRRRPVVEAVPQPPMPDRVAQVMPACSRTVRVAAGLLLGGSMPARAILGLRVGEVRPAGGGAVVCHDGREIAVLGCCVDELLSLVNGQEVDAPVFPGRSLDGTSSVQGFARHLARVSRRVLGVVIRPTELRTLGRLLFRPGEDGGPSPAAIPTWSAFGTLLPPVTMQAALPRVGDPTPDHAVGRLPLAVQRLKRKLRSSEARLLAEREAREQQGRCEAEQRCALQQEIDELKATGERDARRRKADKEKLTRWKRKLVEEGAAFRAQLEELTSRTTALEEHRARAAQRAKARAGARAQQAQVRSELFVRPPPSTSSERPPAEHTGRPTRQSIPTRGSGAVEHREEAERLIPRPARRRGPVRPQHPSTAPDPSAAARPPRPPSPIEVEQLWEQRLQFVKRQAKRNPIARSLDRWLTRQHKRVQDRERVRRAYERLIAGNFTNLGPPPRGIRGWEEVADLLRRGP